MRQQESYVRRRRRRRRRQGRGKRRRRRKGLSVIRCIIYPLTKCLAL